MDFSFLSDLKKVLPNFNIIHNEIEDILRSNVGNELKVQKLLLFYFQDKRPEYGHYSLLTEANYINKLFPSVKFEYILQQLEIFKDMTNRQEIVLRVIINSKDFSNSGPVAASVGGAKRAIPHLQSLDNGSNYHPVIKVRKLTDLSQPCTVTSDQQVATDLTVPAIGSTKPLILNGLQPSHSNPEITKNKNYFPIIKPALLHSTSTPASSSLGDTVKPQDITNPWITPMVNSEYEIPDIMEHFDLPVIISQNCTVSSTATNLEIPDDQLPVVENCTIRFAEDHIVKANSKAENVKRIAQELKNSVKALELKQKKDIEWLSHYKLPQFVTTQINKEPADTPAPEAASTSQPRDSQDSNQTEVYSPDMDVLAETILFQTRPPLNPTTIKTNEERNAVNVVAQEQQDIVTSNQNKSSIKEGVQEKEIVPANAPFFLHAPSTSKQQDQTNVNMGDENFNLVEYVREITSCSVEIITLHCNRLNLSTTHKPPPVLLNMLVNRILTRKRSLSESDAENQSDNDSDQDVIEQSVLFVEENRTPVTSNPPESSSTTNDSTNIAVAKAPEKPQDTSESGRYDIQLVNSLCSIFPDACPKYVQGLCKGKVMNNLVLDDLITVILNANNQYPKRPERAPEPDVVPENQLEILIEFLPDADPDYLRMMCDKFGGKPDEVKSFLNEAMEKRDYPTMKDYQRRQQLSAQQKQYTTEFNVENYIKVIPDPHAFFSDPSRKLKLDVSDSHYALVFMRNRFNRLSIRTIQSVFNKNGCNIAKTIKELEESSLTMKSIRKPIDMPNNIANIPLLQELAYYSHEKEINKYLQQQKEKEETERQEAKNNGLMQTCTCCYDEEVLPRDIYCCEEGCEFCKACIVKSSEVRFGEGKLDFPCLMTCSASFTLQTLQAALPPKLFSKIAQKKALEEIKTAGIAELEMCPFCDFATIPAEGYNIFTCMNPECMKESCRMCKEPSHIPLRCEEIEKDEEVRARTFVENKMTEALLRKCWKCGIKFFKEEGCNKMTCSCGAQMCYVCNQPVTSYKHFNGNGGDRYDLCPLYSDTSVLNKDNVLKGAEAAKAEIGNVNLKHDPTLDVNKHYQDRKKKYPQDHLLAGQIPPPRAHLEPVQLFARIEGLFQPVQGRYPF